MASSLIKFEVLAQNCKTFSTIVCKRHDYFSTVWHKADDTSDVEDVNDVIDDGGSDVVSDAEHDVILPEIPRALISREQTAMSLADFYGPSPSPTRDLGECPF